MKLFDNKYCQYNKLIITFNFTNDDIRSVEKSCPIPCENEFLTVDFNTKNYSGANKIYLIPKTNFKPIFTHHLSMDINKFIYDIGGTIGMWFCVSALTIPDYIYLGYKSIAFNIIRNNLVLIFKLIIKHIKLSIFQLLFLITLNFIKILTKNTMLIIGRILPNN